LFWQVQGGADGAQYLVVGGSPAQIEFGVNVFGSFDLVHCANLLIRRASQVLGCLLPSYKSWSLRRLDITGNYKLQDERQVKRALRLLLGADSKRQKPTSGGGDTVVWGAGSDLIRGKAYHKGPQIEKLYRSPKNRITIELSDLQIRALYSVLRLELTLGSRYFRRQTVDWWSAHLEYETAYYNYFSKFIGSVEVIDMESLMHKLDMLVKSGFVIYGKPLTHSQAMQAHRTWALCRTVGYDVTRLSMSATTFCRHAKILQAAGISEADLVTGSFTDFRRDTIVISNPVCTWEQLLAA
jgi:II/X family phage/plasmid replication protein